MRLGLRATCSFYGAINASALLAIALAVGLDILPPISIALPLLLMLMGFYIAVTLAKNASKRMVLANAIKVTLAIHAVGTMWLVLLAWS